MTARFGLTFDYLCPFARNASEHVVTAMRDGAPWDVDFTPFSLSQCHVEESQPDVWDRDDADRVPGLLALQAGVAVRDTQPDRFLDAHLELFAARHDRAGDLRDLDVVRGALDRAGVDTDAVVDVLTGGSPFDVVHKEHDRNVADHAVWGVPTFIGRDRSVFVRLMTRPEGDADVARRTVGTVLGLLDGVPALHEFKQTDLRR